MENNLERFSLAAIQYRLRESIKHSGKTQREIAIFLGVTEQTVSKNMNNDIFPALDTFGKLCYFIDVSSEYILGIKEE